MALDKLLISFRVWERVARSITKPWPKELAEVDVRYWSARAEQAEEFPPGRVFLAERWGWGPSATSRLIARVRAGAL